MAEPKEKGKTKEEESSQYDDLIPRHMLPEKSVIPGWKQFGYGIDEEEESSKKKKPKKEVKKEPKKMASGGYVRAADGVAVRGKTRGKMV